MTLTQCNAHSTGFNHMAKITTDPMTSDYHSVPTDDKDKYIKTFDAADDPIVYVLIRTSPYTMDDMVLGVFDSRSAIIRRLSRIMDRPENDEVFKIETHNLRNYKQEMELDA
jgi:hypothetical protein